MQRAYLPVHTTGGSEHVAGRCILHASKHTHTHKPRSQRRVPRHTETPKCPQGDLAKGSPGKKQERIREGKAGWRAPRSVLTHLVSGCQSWQWVWEAGRRLLERELLHGGVLVVSEQQVFGGAGTGLVWLKDLGTGGLQTHWQRDSLRTLRAQPHDTRGHYTQRRRRAWWQPRGAAQRRHGERLRTRSRGAPAPTHGPAATSNRCAGAGAGPGLGVCLPFALRSEGSLGS